MSVDINDLLESIVTGTDTTGPNEIAAIAMNSLDNEDFGAVLSKVMPKYVQWWLAEYRRWREPDEEETLEVEKFAPDDLLTDGAQVVAGAQKKKMLISRGSSRVNAMREEWQRQFTARVWTGSQYKVFGDMTAIDLKGAAEALRGQASAKVTKATYYERIASALGDTGVVRGLTDNPAKD